MARSKGAAAVTDDVNGGRTEHSDCGSRVSPSLPNHPAQYAVTDGRLAVGTVEVIAGCYVALDCDGTIIGRYGTLKLAVRALPDRRNPTASQKAIALAMISPEPAKTALGKKAPATLSKIKSVNAGRPSVARDVLQRSPKQYALAGARSSS